MTSFLFVLNDKQAINLTKQMMKKAKNKQPFDNYGNHSDDVVWDKVEFDTSSLAQQTKRMKSDKGCEKK